MISSADIDQTGQYRYFLKRIWNEDIQPVTWIMLNPSTADAYDNDPTINKCIKFTKRYGFGGIHVYNVFALRSTNPKILKTHDDPFGPDNLAYLLKALRQNNPIIAAWGNHPISSAVIALIEMHHVYCLGLNKNGSPKHPLYLKDDTMMHPYSTPAITRWMHDPLNLRELNDLFQ